MQKNVRETKYVMKILYALGMIFVVAGHCEEGGVSLLYEWFPPYTFHLALFVFASGYLYQYEGGTGIGRFVAKKAVRLILPVYLWNLFYWGMIQLLSFGGFTIGADVSIGDMLLGIIKNGHQLEYTMGGWFVVPLFMVQVFQAIVMWILHRLNCKYGDYIQLAIHMVGGILGVSLAMAGYHTGWYLVLVRMLFFLPFFGIGRFYRQKLEKYDKLPSFWYLGVLFALQLVIIMYHGKVPMYLPSWCNNFDSVIWPYAVGFIGIAFWLRIARLLEPVLGRSKWVHLIADNTYAIMMNHFMGFMLVKTVFAGLNQFLGLCSSFDWGRYKTDIWYLYLVKEQPQTKILYLIAGIAFAIGIQWCFRKVGTKIIPLYKGQK